MHIQKHLNTNPNRMFLYSHNPDYDKTGINKRTFAVLSDIIGALLPDSFAIDKMEFEKYANTAFFNQTA